LFRIALRYGVDMNDLAAANDITDPTRILVGQELVIPGLSAPDAGDSIENPLVATAPIIHIIQRGETLGNIAQFYGVTVEQILQANNIANPNTIYAGQELQIWTADASAPLPEETPAPQPTPAEVLPTPEPAPITHIVQRGEHLSQIARDYGVPWTNIAEANGITNPNTIYAGMSLTIPGTAASQQPPVTSRVPTIAENLDDPGAHWGTGRELVVDLSTQMAYAYEDGALKHSALVSTGLPATPTVQGEYAIWHKTPSQTMSGPGYWLPNVQWVMYFYQGYGFHGTYWHNNFGQPMSHGCVNMTNEDALWFYNFASLGTPVYVQY
jgi:LysM repeat protein